MSHEDTVLRALQDAPGTARQLVERTGLHLQRVREALRKLEGAGRARREEQARQPGQPGVVPQVWRVDDRAEEEADVLDSLQTLGRSTVLELSEDTGRLVPEVAAACERLVRRGLAVRCGSAGYRAAESREEAA